MNTVLSLSLAAPLDCVAPVVGERQMVASLANADKPTSEMAAAMMLVLKNIMVRLEVEEDFLLPDAPEQVLWQLPTTSQKKARVMGR